LNFVYPNLKVSDIKFKEFFDYIPNPIYIWKKIENKLLLVYYNRATENITNFKIKEFLERTAKEIYKDKPQIIEDLHQCINKKLNFSREMSYKLISVDKEKHFYVTYNYISPDLIFVHTEDITKQKKAEGNLRKSEIEKTFILNGISELIVFQDTKNNIIWANKVAGDSVGISQDDLVGRKCYEVWHNREIPCKICPVNRAVKTGNQEIDGVISPDGREWIIKGFPIRDENSTLIGIVEVAEDITAKKQTERKLKESEEKYRHAYSRTNLYKDIFTHDINNILQNILSSLELSKIFSHDPNKKKEFEDVTTLINGEVIRGRNLVSNVQKMSDVEDLKIYVGSIEAFNILKQAIDLLKKNYPHRKIVIGIEASQEEYYVFANELLKSVFENVFFNCVTHNRNPIIEISVKISNEKKDRVDYIRFEFTDNGMGIPDSMKKNIFVREYKDSEIPTGIGLGLLLVKRILESYEGEIKVEDRIRGDYSKGSNFIILIPKAV